MHLLSWEVLDGHGDNLKIRLERDTNVSNYAILSHRWGNPRDEVSYEDMLTGEPEDKSGYMKLVGCCQQARRDGLHHVWIDTCCINKASSAELSEAITSMFTYYERSKICYVFLNDVLTGSSASEELRFSSFSRSAWFTRGWTLQELIAPSRVKFFDASWGFLGYKTDESLCRVIESVTKIDSIVLNIPATTKLISISKKMSWAARRKSTRVEDMAYSLMGIFGIYMTPLYGEGNHAFIRLQEAIMRTSNDHTIFAWTSPPLAPLSHGFEHVSTMMALSPDQFEHSSNFQPLSHSEHSEALTPNGHKFDYAITNTGLSIRLPLLKIHEVEGLYAAFLACTEGGDRTPSAILLRTTDKTPRKHFWRTNSNKGPIERSEQYWFPTSGRSAINTCNIYVLPRFTSVSGDNVEPSWSRVDLEPPTWNPLLSGSGAKADNFVIKPEVLKDLYQVPDPTFRELGFLHQAHQMIHANQADNLVKLNKTRMQLPQSIPFLRNRNFCGRVAVLQKLRDVFFPAETDLQGHHSGSTRCIISGMIGIGKSEVAVEFTHDCIENHLFDAVIWIDVESSKSIVDGFRRIISELDLYIDNPIFARVLIHAESSKPIMDEFRRIVSKLDLDEPQSQKKMTVFEILQWLCNFNRHINVQSGRSASLAPWLLVYDNCDDLKLLLPFWPLNGHDYVLVTSRDTDSFPLNCEKITLKAFTTQETSELLSNLEVTRCDWDDWDSTAVSERLDGHPLAIVQSAGFMVEYKLSLEEFLLNFDTNETEVLGPRWMPRKYNRNLVDVWSLCVKSLPISSRGVLQVISFLDSGFIQDSILISSQAVALAEFPQTNHANRWQSLSDLTSAGLITRAGERRGLHVHRLIQDVVRIKMDTDEFQKALSTAVTLVFSAWINTYSGEQGKPSNLRTRENLLPHVVRLKDFATEMTDSEDGFCTKTDFVKLLSYVDESGFLH